MSKYPHRAFLPYLCTVVALGFLVITHSIRELLGGGISYYWLLLAFLTVITSLVAIKVPGVDSKISIEDVFFFTNLILFGPAPGTITAALQGLSGSILAKPAARRVEFALFNTGALAISAFVSGRIFFLLLGREPLFYRPAPAFGEMLVPMGALAIVHYLANSCTVALVIALDLRVSFYSVWQKHFRWTLFAYLSGASVAALIALNASSFGLAMLGAAVPVVLITYFTFKTYREKIEGHIHNLEELNKLYLRTVESLALAVDAKDQSTHGHVRRVRAYAMGLAGLRGLTNQSELLAIETGALLHDIGKLAIDDYILNKPGKLTRHEFERMKAHAAAGEEILELIQFPFPVAKYVRAHHERWDGKGYPDGLRGEEIPIGARVLAIADAYDAVRSLRPYKVSLGSEDTVALLRSGAGTLYDPGLLELFIKNLNQLETSAFEAAKDVPELSFRQYFRKIDPEAYASGTSAPTPPVPATVSDELLSLFEFCSSLGKHLGLSDLLVNLECRISRLLPFSTLAFFLDTGDQNLTAVHAGGKHAGALRGHSMEMGKGISGWVAAYGRSIVNTPAALDFQDLQGDFSSLTVSLVVPIVGDGDCIGTISLYAETPVVYAESHLNLMQTVARNAYSLLAEARGRSATSTAEDQHDPVTRAYRGRCLPILFEQMAAPSVPGTSRLSLVYVCLVNLPQIIERHGPAKGESVLRQVAGTLIAESRETDAVVRFGEENFVALLAGARREQALRRAERLREQLSNVRVGDICQVMSQVSVASYPEDGLTVFDLIDAARRSLAQTGRDTGARSEAGDDTLTDFSTIH